MAQSVERWTPVRGTLVRAYSGGNLQIFLADSGVLLSSLEQGEGGGGVCGSQRYPKIGDNELQAHSVMGKAAGDRESMA